MTRFLTTLLVCAVAVSAAGCAVEVPKSVFRMAPPDATQKTDTAPRQDLKHISID